MPDNLKELLRRVFSVDTEAGYRLRYHIMRALACENYAKEIKFDISMHILPSEKLEVTLT